MISIAEYVNVDETSVIDLQLENDKLNDEVTILSTKLDMMNETIKTYKSDSKLLNDSYIKAVSDVRSDYNSAITMIGVILGASALLVTLFAGWGSIVIPNKILLNIMASQFRKVKLCLVPNQY